VADFFEAPHFSHQSPEQDQTASQTRSS
jgi:hypothetical protein